MYVVLRFANNWDTTLNGLQIETIAHQAGIGGSSNALAYTCDNRTNRVRTQSGCKSTSVQAAAEIHVDTSMSNSPSHQCSTFLVLVYSATCVSMSDWNHPNLPACMGYQNTSQAGMLNIKCVLFNLDMIKVIKTNKTGSYTIEKAC